MINLLPKEIKEQHRVSFKVNGLIALYTLLLILLVAGAIVLFIYNIGLRVETENKKSQLSDIVKDQGENKDLIAKASFIEDRIKSSKTYLETTKWDELLNQIAGSTPSNIQLTEIKISLETNKSTTLGINGKTTERRSIALFKEKMSQLTLITGLKLTNVADVETEGEKAFTFNLQANINQSNAN